MYCKKTSLGSAFVLSETENQNLVGYKLTDTLQPDYPKLYTLLFNAITDSLAALERGELQSAKAILIHGQQLAEELYIQTAADMES